MSNHLAVGRNSVNWEKVEWTRHRSGQWFCSYIQDTNVCLSLTLTGCFIRLNIVMLTLTTTMTPTVTSIVLTLSEYLKTLDDNIYTIYIPRCSSSISPKVCIDSIPEDSFSFKGVQRITMESNGISSVERGAFRGLK